MKEQKDRLFEPFVVNEEDTIRLLELIEHPKKPSDYLKRIFKEYHATLSESEAERILNTPRREDVEAGVLNDLTLSKSERVKRAEDILKSKYRENN